MDIIILIFLAIKIGKLARTKGQAALRWRIYLVLGWLVGEIIGATAGVAFFGKDNVFSWALVSLAGGFTAYFLINNYLSKLPDVLSDEDINNIGR